MKVRVWLCKYVSFEMHYNYELICKSSYDLYLIRETFNYTKKAFTTLSKVPGTLPGIPHLCAIKFIHFSDAFLQNI